MKRYRTCTRRPVMLNSCRRVGRRVLTTLTLHRMVTFAVVKATNSRFLKVRPIVLITWSICPSRMTSRRNVLLPPLSRAWCRLRRGTWENKLEMLLVTRTRVNGLVLLVRKWLITVTVWLLRSYMTCTCRSRFRSQNIERFVALAAQIAVEGVRPCHECKKVA